MNFSFHQNSISAYHKNALQSIKIALFLFLKVEKQIKSVGYGWQSLCSFLIIKTVTYSSANYSIVERVAISIKPNFE